MKADELTESVASALDDDGTGWGWVKQTKGGAIGAVQFLAVILWAIGGSEPDRSRDRQIVDGWAEKLAAATVRRCATLGGRGPTREVVPRDPVTLLELAAISEDWAWVLAVEDADSFLEGAGMGFRCSDVLAYWRGEPSIYDTSNQDPETPQRAQPNQGVEQDQTAASEGQSGAISKTWTPERLAELKAYRAVHGTKKASEKFNVSTARIRSLLPGENSKQGGYSAFTHRLK